VITKIRGNKSYDHVKKFFDLGLIKKKKEGHTHILTLSDDFYDYFSVKNPEKNKDVLRELEKEIAIAEEELKIKEDLSK